MIIIVKFYYPGGQTVKPTRIKYDAACKHEGMGFVYNSNVIRLRGISSNKYRLAK